jgi:hypothetical protein
MNDNNKAGFALLQSFAPSLFTSLREAFPEHKARFEPMGQTLGNEVERVDAVACITALQVSLAICGRAIKKGEHLTSRTSRLVLFASITSAVSSAGLMTVIAADAPKFIEYLVAAITLVSSCATMVGEHYAKGTGGGQIDDAYRSLADLFPKVLTTHARLSGYLKIGDWQPETVQAVKSQVKEGHELCGQVQDAAVTIGVVALPSEQVEAFATAILDNTTAVGQTAKRIPPLKAMNATPSG